MTTETTTTIKHVQGNVLRLAIPLTLRTVTLNNGEVETKDTDFVPTGEVKVLFTKTARQFEYLATMRDGNIAVVEDKGTIPVGCYAITVLCYDANGNPMRFKQNCVVEVKDLTIEAGIDVGTEFESQEWLLDGAIFIAIKGEDGRGIDNIVIDETHVSGEYNSVTFYLTDGTSYTLHIRNGESTEQTLPSGVVRDENYVHTDNNYTSEEKSKVALIDSLFADVQYDRLSRRINFFAKGDTTHTRPLAYIDATDFVRDGMVSRVQVVNGYLRITFNTDSGKDPINLPISDIFNPENYYTKSSTDALLVNKANTSELNNKADLVGDKKVVPFSQLPPVVLDEIDFVVGDYTISQLARYVGKIVCTDNGEIIGFERKSTQIQGATPYSIADADSSHVYYCLADSTFYRWSGNAMVKITSGSGGGINATYSNGTITFTGSGSSQPTYSNGTIIL